MRSVLVPVPVPSTPKTGRRIGLIRSPTVVVAKSVSRKYKRLRGRPSPLRDSVRLRRSISRAGGETPGPIEPTHANGRAGTLQGCHNSGGADGETGGEGESDTEADHETPKSRKRVRRPQRWKKSKRIRLRNTGKKIYFCPRQRGSSS